MKRKKKPVLVSVVGARPQFIKLAPLAGLLNRRFRHLVVHTGQHYDRMMSDIFFKQLKIPRADYNLRVGSGLHGRMTAEIITRLENLLVRIQPDIVLVYGDTNSTLAGALTAAKLNIPVGHIEAGLRSHRMDMPEEINRCLTDRLAELLFCPTPEAINNLKKEGIKRGIVHSGDLMYELIDLMKTGIDRNRAPMEKYSLAAGEFLLITIHRAGNVDSQENLNRIVEILLGLKERVVFPVHPHSMKNLKKYKLLDRLLKVPHLVLIEPLSYLDNLTLIKNARAVLTDSGGVQKEAVFLGTPCLTLRDETEWVETLGQGNSLVGLSLKKIRRNLKNPLRPGAKKSCRIKNKKPSEIIAASIKAYFRDN
nr:UDP-N-acetylglucosamine 2-epimerase (non-hydrolyzing) [candidate division Zixibacteria bacterium]